MATGQPAFTLRARGLGELLDQTIRLYRRNFVVFIGILGVVQVPLSVISIVVNAIFLRGTAQAAVTPDPADPFAIFTPAYFTSIGVSLFIGLLSFILISGVATAAITGAVTDNYLGKPVSIAGAYRRIGSVWLPLLGTLFVAGLVGVALTLWTLVPCVGWLTGLGASAFFAFIVVPLTAPVVVLERRNYFDALRRSWDLARTRFWWVLVFAVVLFIFGQLVVGGPVLIVQTIFQVLFLDSASTGQVANLFTLQIILQGLVSLILGLLYTPLQLVAMTLLYLDLRVRSEGLDLALQAESDATAATEALTRAPVTLGRDLVTMPEVGNFTALTVGSFGLLCGCYALLVGFVIALGAALGGL